MDSQGSPFLRALGAACSAPETKVFPVEATRSCPDCGRPVNDKIFRNGDLTWTGFDLHKYKDHQVAPPHDILEQFLQLHMNLQSVHE